MSIGASHVCAGEWPYIHDSAQEVIGIFVMVNNWASTAVPVNMWHR